MNITTGMFLFGKCLGVSQETWESKGKSGTNYRLGISRILLGQYGEETEQTENVDITKDDFEHIAKQAAMLKGKLCVIQVIPSAHVGGRNGAFLKLRAPKGASLYPWNAKPAVAGAA